MRISDWSSDVCSSDLFKIAFDEALGRFSPGVLIEIANLQAVLGDPAIGWMDSCAAADHPMIDRSEEHTSELQSLMRISYAVFCMKKKRQYNRNTHMNTHIVNTEVISTHRYHNMQTNRMKIINTRNTL